MSTNKRIRRALFLAAIISSGIIALIPCRVISFTAPVSAPQQVPTNPIDEIRSVASIKGVAANDLLAISAQESSLGRFTTGDSGCSRGWFHINLCANPSAANVIGDITAESSWVADRLLSYGYHADRILAIARYNAPAAPNYAYAALVEKRLGELELFLVRYEPAKPQTPR